MQWYGRFDRGQEISFVSPLATLPNQSMKRGQIDYQQRDCDSDVIHHFQILPSFMLIYVCRHIL